MDDNIAKLTSIIDFEWRTKHFKTQKFHNRDDSDNFCLGQEMGRRAKVSKINNFQLKLYPCLHTCFPTRLMSEI